MSVTTIQEKLAASGARFGVYRGADTPVSFGDTAAEFRALLQGCAIVDMRWQAKLVLTGEDRVRWLNGMVTNNVRDLAPGHGNYSFLLNAQGRIQGELVSYNRSDYLLVTTDRGQAPAITAIFDRYIIMDDVEVADISDKLTTIGIAGPKACQVLSDAGVDVSQLELGQVIDTVWRDLGISVARSAQPPIDGHEIWFSADNADKVWDALLSAGAEPAGSEALDLYRMVRGVPRFGVDLRDRDLPQETGQDYALNFAKGCYIGQEIVERIRSRAILHRTFVGLEVEGEPPAPGTKIQVNDKNAGEMTSAARVPFPGGERTVALGYAHREIAIPGTAVKIGEQSATVAALPFHD